MSGKSIWIIALSLLFTVSLAQGNEIPENSIRMFRDDSFSDEQSKFYPSDQIYVVVDFTNIHTGDYTLNIDWILPSGKLVKNDSLTFTLDQSLGMYRVYFWLQLHEKGPLKQMFTGSEYSKAVYGNWKAKLYFNGETMGEVEFEVTDSVI